MSITYPTLHRLTSPQSPHCSACAHRATAGVLVSLSPLRRRSYSACERHVRMAYDTIGRFLAHVRSRERWLAEQQRDVILNEAEANR